MIRIRTAAADGDLARVATVAGLLVLAAAVGIAAGRSPTYALVVAFGLIFTAVVMTSPMAGLLLFICVSFLEVLNSSGGSTSLSKLAGLLLFASWAARGMITRTLGRARSVTELSPMVVWGALALLTWSAISVAWAIKPSAAIGATSRFALDMLLIPIVSGIVRTRRQVILFAAAFVFGAVLSSIYGFVHGSALSGFQSGQLTGAIGDANEQAAVLVAAIALAFGLAASLYRSPLGRAAAVGAIVVALAGTVNTLSRSGLIALAVMMLAGVFAGGAWRKWAATLLVFSAVIGVGYYVTITSPAARERVTSSDTSGRSTIWAVGWRMVKAHPLNGVGSANFQDASINYLRSPGLLTRTDLIVDTPKVAHNIYLEELADLGIIGLAFFLAVLIGALAAAWRAATEFRRQRNLGMEVMSRACVLAMTGFMASDFFLSGEFSKQLWLIIALGPTLLGIARRGETSIEASEALKPRPQAPALVPRLAESR